MAPRPPSHTPPSTPLLLERFLCSSIRHAALPLANKSTRCSYQMPTRNSSHGNASSVCMQSAHPLHNAQSFAYSLRHACHTQPRRFMLPPRSTSSSLNAYVEVDGYTSTHFCNKPPTINIPKASQARTLAAKYPQPSPSDSGHQHPRRQWLSHNLLFDHIKNQDDPSSTLPLCPSSIILSLTTKNVTRRSRPSRKSSGLGAQFLLRWKKLTTRSHRHLQHEQRPVTFPTKHEFVQQLRPTRNPTESHHACSAKG